MMRIDLLDQTRNVTYERKMPAPRAYAQSAPVKLTRARCLNALAGFASFSIISLALAAERLASGEELLIGAVLAYTGISNLGRVFAIWKLYGRISRGETIYVQNQSRRPANRALSIATAIILTLLVLIVSVILLGVTIGSGVNVIVRIAAVFMALMLWSIVVQCWKRIRP